jgi:hypothetical protein
MSDQFDPYHRWLAIKPQDQPPNHYRLLGIDLFENDPAVIENAADQRMVHLRTFSSGPHGKLAQRLLNEVSAARICLLSPEKRQEYDEQLRACGVGAAPIPKPAPLPMAKPLTTQPSPVVTTGPPQSSIAASRARARRQTISPVALLAGGGGALLLVVAVVIAVIASGGGDSEDDGAADSSPPVVQSDGQPAPPPPTVTQSVHPVVISIDSGDALPPGGEIDLLSESSATALSSPPPWSRRGGTLVADLAAEQPPRLRAAVGVPVEYRLELTAVAPAEHAGVVFDLPSDGRRFQLLVDRQEQGTYYSGLELTNAASEQRGSRRQQPLLSPGVAKSLSCTVRPGQVVLACDGEEVLRWQGDPASLVASADDPPPRQFERQPPLDAVPMTIEDLRVVSLMPETPPPVVQNPTPPREPPKEPTAVKPTTTEPPKTVLRAVPDEAEEARARAEVNRTFAAGREKAQTREAKLDLAKELLATAAKVEDKAVQYVLLREGRELAVEAEEATVALAAVDRLEQDFEVDAWQLRGDALARIANTAKSPLRREMALGAAQQVIHGAIDDAAFDAADQLAETVQVVSRRAKQIPLAKLATDLRRDIAVRREQQAAVEAARAALETNPDDPAAHGVLGGWLMQQQQWSEAMSHLAKSDDAAARSAAEKELAAGDEPSPEAQLKLAEAWRMLAQSRNADSSTDALAAAMLARARLWYEAALPKLDSPLSKRRVEDLLAAMAVESSGGARPPVVLTAWLLRDALLVYNFEPASFGKVGGKFLLADLSGRGHHGTVVGSPRPQVLNKGKAGTALGFQGRDDAVVISGLRNAMAAGLTQFTIAAWIEPEKLDGTAFIFDVGNNGQRNVCLYLDQGDCVLHVVAAGGDRLRAPFTKSPGWHHLAGVWDGKEQRLYVDGQLVGRRPTTPRVIDGRTLGPENAHLGIQAKPDRRAGRWYIGAIDELFVLPRALSQQEIAACVEAGKAGIVLPSLVER